MRPSFRLLILAAIAVGVFAALESAREEPDSARGEHGPAADEGASGSQEPASRADQSMDAPLASRSGGEPDPAGRVATVRESTTGGIVEGTVRYRKVEGGRRWRYARYYVRNSREGRLAEAVVSLRGASLAAALEGGEHRTRTVDQKDFQFTPETLAIRRNDSVRFTNSDQTVHNVRTLDGSRPFNVSLTSGSEYVHEFPRAGGIGKPVRLGCVFHGTMRAWIYVFDHPFFHVTSADGRFRFEGVPPGEYWLDMVHPAGGLKWSRRIEVESGNTTEVEISVSADDKLTDDEQIKDSRQEDE